MSIRIEERRGKITVAEAGRMGGKKTASTHGHDFYEEIGRKGGVKVAKEKGPEFYSAIGRMGGVNKGNRIRRLRIRRAKGIETPNTSK